MNLNKHDKDAAVKAILEYVYFIENNRDKNGELAPEDPVKFDARRRQLHLSAADAFGLTENSRPNYKDALYFEFLDGWGWDKWVAGGEKLEAYAEWKYCDVIDQINNRNATYTTVETAYNQKLRIDDIIRWTKEKIERRMKPIDEVMDTYKRNQDAWNRDHCEKNKNEPYAHDHSNRHDYNGLTHTIKKAVHQIELFAEQPMEAYLKVAVDKYIDEPLETINETLNKLDGLAFRAQERYLREPFYRYIQHTEGVEPEA